jgi:hypothetical protein
MRSRLPRLALLAAVAALAPGLALGLGTLEGFYGLSRPPGTSFRAAVSGAADDPHVFEDSLQIVGANLLLDFGGPLEVGAIVDRSWAAHSATQTALGALLGYKLSLGALRVDLLGEAGGHRYGDLTRDPAVVTASSTDQWLAYVGLRPGIAFHVGRPGIAFHVGRPGAPCLLLGVWTYARWDLTSKRVPVTVAGAGGATADGSVRLGGPTIGASLRAGLEF